MQTAIAYSATDGGVNVQNERPLSLETPTISYINRYIYIRPVWAHSGSTGSDEIVHCLSHQVPTFTHYCTTETSKACSVGLFRCRLGGISPRRPRGGFKAPRAVIVTNLIWIPQLGNMFKFIPMTVEKHFDISICFSRCMDGGRHTILYRATTNLQEFYDFWLNWKIGSQ